VADINKEMIDNASSVAGPAGLKIVTLAWEMFKYNPIKLGFLALMILFGWQIVDGQKVLERVSEKHTAEIQGIISRHDAAAERAHGHFAKTLDKLDLSLERLGNKVEENTRAIITRSNK
jgi:hypothetical protein